MSKHQRVEPTCWCFAAGCSDDKHNTFDAEGNQNINSPRPSSGAPDEDDFSAPEQPHVSAADADEDSLHPLHDDAGPLRSDPPEEAADAEESVAEESFEETEEEEDSEDDDSQSCSFKTPLFHLVKW